MVFVCVYQLVLPKSNRRILPSVFIGQSDEHPATILTSPKYKILSVAEGITVQAALAKLRVEKSHGIEPRSLFQNIIDKNICR